MATLQEVRQLAESRGARRLDLRASDFTGRWLRVSVPLDRLGPELVDHGVGCDRGALEGSDARGPELMLVPDLDTAAVDPVAAQPTLSLVCRIVDPVTHGRYARDPRHVAERAEEHLRASGVADRAVFAAPLQFFLFDDVRYQQAAHTGFYFVDSAEGAWNSGRDEAPNLATTTPEGRGYQQGPPFDTLAEVRWAVVEALGAIGAQVMSARHEAAAAGQSEVALGHGPLVRKGDETQWARHIVRNVARANGRVATFMPKPLHGQAGSGMPAHQSLWRGDTPTFFDSNGYAGLSQLARYYIGGLLQHAPALLAFCAPTTNSYRRLMAEESPVHLTYSVRSPSAIVRVPSLPPTPAGTRVEFRPPDGTANPYLAFAAMLMAGLDGIQSRIEPGDPLDKHVDELSATELARVQTLPTSLDAALDALAADQAFLRKGDVFSPEVIDGWIALKRDEAAAVRARPTPYEYELYFTG